ncbi:MAG: UPF0182 family protein [Synergistes sp.]|nr:UPF0182 family protein [Synergistes sp.]
MNINDIFQRFVNEKINGHGREEQPKRKTNKLLAAAVSLFALFGLILPWLSGIITDLYWFEAQGFAILFWRRYIAQAQLFAAAFVASFVIFAANCFIAARNGGGIDVSDTPIAKKKNIFLVCAVVSALFALYSMGMWDEFLKFMHPTSFGKKDPLFGMDISFYVFTLPFVQYILGWLRGIVFFAGIASAVIYFVKGCTGISDGKFFIAAEMRLHLTVLVSLFLALFGGTYWLDRYELLFSPTGVVFGAGYTDEHILLPALSAMAVAMFAAAVLLFVNFFKPMWKASVIFVIFLFAAGFAARALLPAAIQQYIVKPNEYEMEKKYLGYHLDFTRSAFGLDNVRSVSFTPEGEVTASELADDNETVQNIRLWDYSPLLRTYRQLQAIRTYYNFEDVFIDRYPLNGKNRQVMLAVRELDLSKLQNPTWVNTHLEFTHGYGVVMNPVNEISSGGMPYFFMKDIPVHENVNIPIERPQIYFGSGNYEYALVKTKVKEFDYPMGASNVRNVYDGDGGVPIGSLWRRILFALRFRDSEILFTGSLSKESRVLYNRNVRMAFEKAAPFLIYDAETYPVIIDGRILWVQDAFTWSERYPYSNPFFSADDTLIHFTGVNYIRNSVKCVEDAYTGRMEFFAVDENDPVLATWKKIFPGVFKGRDKVSEELCAHFRYPEDFFEVQTEVHRTYHMTDTNTYYNREDVWEVTPVGRKRRIQPNYVTMKLWGEKTPEFAIIVPYMPLGRDNLIGWMAGRCDSKSYGELLVYQFPKQKLIYGPGQVEALIDQNPEISAQLSLWSQRGSDVIRGDLLVVPVGKSLLYVQPLYLKAETGELPELKRVIVSTGGKVAWAEDFGAALEKLMGQKVTLSTGTKRENVGNTAQPSAQTPTGNDRKSLAAEASALYNAAISAQKNGDWALYGEKIKKLGDIISKLQEK